MIYRVFAILLISVVFPHTYAGTHTEAELNRELSEWKGLPVTLSADSLDAVLAVEGSFSIRKNEASHADDEESITISAADSAGLLNGMHFLLRAQQQRDTCLCVTMPHYDTVWILPLFPSRVVEYDRSLIREAEKAHSLPEIVRSDALAGINGWIVAGEEDFHPESAEESDELRKILTQYGISLYKNRGSLGDMVLELTDAGNRKFMGEIWKSQMREASRNGCRSVLYRPEETSSGYHLREINLYAFGRLSSDSNVLPARIVYEWLAKTYTDNPLIVRPLMESLLSEDETTFCTKLKEFETF